MIKKLEPHLYCYWSIKQNLLGLGWKFLLLWRSWLEGLIIWRRNALKEFAFAITANSHLLGETRTALPVKGRPGRGLRWMLHLNEPGWVVGAHKHVLIVACGFEWWGGAVFEAMESKVRLLIKEPAGLFWCAKLVGKQWNCKLYIASFGFPYYLYDPCIIFWVLSYSFVWKFSSITNLPFLHLPLY